MGLESEPSEGITVDEDLSSTTITLTQRRRGWFWLILGALVIQVLAWRALGLGLGLFYVWTVVVGALLDRFRTRIHLSPHALSVEKRWLGRSMSRSVVPYRALRGIQTESSLFAGSVLRIECVEGPPIRVRHGSAADHQELLEQLEERMGEPGDQQDLQAPAALQAMLARRVDSAPGS